MITESDIANVMVAVNTNYTTNKNNNIQSKRLIVLLVNNKVTYYYELDGLLKKIDQEYNNDEVISLLFNRSNNVLQVDDLGSKYLKSCLLNFTNIKLYLVTIPYGNFNDQIVSSRQGTYRP